jgi:chromosome segregation ATPase
MAKDETIKAKDAQIEALRNAQDETIRAKDAQIEALRDAADESIRAKDAQIAAVESQIEFYRDLTPMKLRECFVSTREQLEEQIDLLAQKLQDSQATIAEKDAEIVRFRVEGEAQAAEIESLETELKYLKTTQAQIISDLQELHEAEEALATLESDRVWPRVWKVLEVETKKPLIIGGTSDLRRDP